MDRRILTAMRDCLQHEAAHLGSTGLGPPGRRPTAASQAAPLPAWSPWGTRTCPSACSHGFRPHLVSCSLRSLLGQTSVWDVQTSPLRKTWSGLGFRGTYKQGRINYLSERFCVFKKVREEERKGERHPCEKHWSGASHTCPFGTKPQPRPVPCPGIYLQPFRCEG